MGVLFSQKGMETFSNFSGRQIGANIMPEGPLGTMGKEVALKGFRPEAKMQVDTRNAKQTGIFFPVS